MANSIKKTKEDSPVIDEMEESINIPELKKDMPFIYIPDIPAQMIEVNEPVLSEQVNVVNIESETLFLTRLMEYQNNGGWGRHLNPMITERLKILNDK